MDNHIGADSQRYYFPLMAYQKKDLFYIMYFLLYNPNLKSVFCRRTYINTFFLMLFWFVCEVRLGYVRLVITLHNSYFNLID